MAMAVGIANLVGSCHIVSEKCSMPKLCVDVQTAQQCGALRRKRRSACVVASSSAVESEESWVRSGAVAIGAAAMVLLATGGAPAAMAVAEGGDVAPFQTYYGTAASASSYGGYGGNANKKDSAEYIFDVPQVRIVFVFKLNHTLHHKAKCTLLRIWCKAMEMNSMQLECGCSRSRIFEMR